VQSGRVAGQDGPAPRTLSLTFLLHRRATPGVAGPTPPALGSVHAGYDMFSALM